MSRWYAFSSPANSQAKDRVEVSIYDEIGGFGVSAKDFLSDLKDHKGKHVDLRINSVGGSVIEGAAIYNGLRRHKGGLTVHVDGLAASMASVIAMAGEETLMADNAMLMIHNPWSMAIGDGEDLRKEADILDKLKSTLVSAYAKKTGIERADLERMMDDETWFDATEAVALGFADGIEDGTEAAASIGDRASKFDKFTDRMAAKSKKKCLAEEVAPQAEPETPAAEQPADETVEATAVDTLSEVNMNAELQAKVDELQAKLAEEEVAKAQAADDNAKALEAAQAEVARLSSEIAHKDEELAALRSDAKSAGEQAAAIVAAAGLPAEAASVAAGQPTASEIFGSMEEGPDKVAFFRAHKREILATFKR